MKKKVLLSIILVAIVLLGGCATTFTASDGMLGYGEIKGKDVGDFKGSTSYMYIIHPELITLGDKPWGNLEDIIEPELRRAGANAATDLVITNGFTAIDFLLTYITGGFLGFGHLTVSGTALDQ
jgi:hypothetical protein